MGLFDSDSDEDNSLFGAASEPASIGSAVTRKAGLFGDAGDAGSSLPQSTQQKNNDSGRGGLFGDESESDSEPPAKAPAPQQQQPNPAPVKSGGLFGDSDEDDDETPFMAAASSAPKTGGGGGGLFGDESESDSELPVKAPAPPPSSQQQQQQQQQQQPNPAPGKVKSEGLFGDSDEDNEDGGPLMAAAAPAPNPAAAALPTKRSGGGLFGDDSDSDSDAAELFGVSSKLGNGSKAATAPAGLFANDAASDDDGGLFGSAGGKSSGDGSKAATAPAGLFANDAASNDDGGLFGSAGGKNSGEAEVSSNGQWDQSSVGRLIDMGFARVDVEAALTAKDGDVQQAADWLLVGGTAAAVDRTSLSSADASSTVDGGLDQASSFHGVTVFTRPAGVAAEPEAAATGAAVGAAGVAEGSETARASDTQRRPVRGDRVTVCKQPRNTDFLRPGQVGTVVDIDDMDVEDVWFTVEDEDGETDEYCEADLVIANATAVTNGEGVDESRAAVAAPAAAPAAAPEPVSAGKISGQASQSQGVKKHDAGGVEIAASAQKLMAQSKVKGLFDDSDDSDGGGGLFD